ncbi:MAG TPA: M13 family metallopeptidase, partial [Balneolaceae bacterium]|nr:M13 family metallopeptidase [Balneolaceae bacterium]
TWIKNTKIPPTKAAWGSFNNAHDKVLHRMHTILDSVSNLNDPKQGSIAQQTGDMYASAMDSTAIEKAGIQPLRNDLDHIASIKNADDIIHEVAREYKNGEGTLFSFHVGPGTKHSMIERVHLNQGGLGLPNRNYYIKKNSQFKQLRNAYQHYIATVLSLSGDPKSTADREANDIIDLETKMAEASKPPVKLRNPQANYHLLTIRKLDDQTPNIDWKNVFNQMNIGVDTVQVGQPEFYRQLSDLVNSTPVSVWKAYLRFHLISGYASWLSSPYAKANFNFSRLLSGQKKRQPRWKRASALVDHTLGDALGQLYVKRYFPPKDKKYMKNLVNNLQNTYRNRLKHEAWMSDSTKAKAIAKLNALVKKIGYPDEWKDYSSIEINSKNIIKNLRHYGQWHYKYMIDKLGKPVDRNEWFMTPPTVNSYYNPSFNEVVFPAGILQPPFYYPGADDAVNYGAVGMVIGHEMTHGFDDQGSQYDKKGDLHNWWTKMDSIRFHQRTQKLVKQYDKYTVLDSLHVNGKLTLGENIADNGGLAIAYAAFQKTPEAKGGKKIDGLTPDQRFFLAYAQVWRMKERPKYKRFAIHNDVHSPPKYRVIGPASNMTAFYKAFDVQPSDSMYRPDSVRAKIW